MDRFTGTTEDELIGHDYPESRQKMIELFDRVFGKDISFQVYGGLHGEGFSNYDEELETMYGPKTLKRLKEEGQLADVISGNTTESGEIPTEKDGMPMFPYAVGSYKGMPYLTGGYPYQDYYGNSFDALYTRESDAKSWEDEFPILLDDEDHGAFQCSVCKEMDMDCECPGGVTWNGKIFYSKSSPEGHLSREMGE